MEETVKQRVKQFCEKENISVREFEKRCNVSNGYFNNLKNGGIAYNKMLIILENFPSLNAEWLANGVGNMLRTPTAQIGFRQQNVNTADRERADMAPQAQAQDEIVRELLRQNAELIRQNGELIQMIKKNYLE